MIVLHDSQNLEYRDPFGAAECGTQVQLRILAGDVFDECTLRLWDGKETLIPMKREGGFFSVCLDMPLEPSVLWYYFMLKGSEGLKYYVNCEDGLGGEGMLSDTPGMSYQITVYRERKTPEWFRNGMIYQIFPDRFRRGEDYKERTAFHEKRRTYLPRLIQTDWNDEPFYQKDEKGEILRWPFFGGTLKGIEEKLDYLKDLGVTVIYLNPVFEASSCHRYDTADYMRIDPVLGDDKSFSDLVSEAEKRGIGIILDGVFSHTGKDSIYFDYYGVFGGGAFSDEGSRFRDWFKKDDDGSFTYWWGVKDLPNLDKDNEDLRAFIYGDDDSVVRHWMRKGIKGLRLDVADELPDDFIEGIRRSMDEEDAESVLIGEVWEDASNKVSYGKLRKYFSGYELNSVMNYPAREAFIDFLLNRCDAVMLKRKLMSLKENYPRENLYSLMNLIGSHDRERILSILGGATEDATVLDGQAKAAAVSKLSIMFELQMMMPGVPSVYYGDEAGMQGLKDPYNRGTFPWDHMDKDVYAAFRSAAALRKEYDVLKTGDFLCHAPLKDVFIMERRGDNDRILLVINTGDTGDIDISSFIGAGSRAVELHSGRLLKEASLKVGHMCSAVVYIRDDVTVYDYGNKKGVLCHVTSLPGEYGCGSFGKESREFVDWMAENGFDIWQVLPLTSVGDGDSPYYSNSVFAGNEMLIDIDDLKERGYITERERRKALLKPVGNRIDFAGTRELREELYRKAYKRFRPDTDYEKFIRDNISWIYDHALYTALKRHFDGRPWQEWPGDARDRKDLEKYTAMLKEEIGYEYFLQYVYDMQLASLKRYANEKGVSLFGDIPIYVAPDSADVWAHRDVFLLDTDGNAPMVAGVPPDYYEGDGQLWGNPLYIWDSKECFPWWKERLKRAFMTLDFVRLDHFRGFEAYWMIPKGSRNGKTGKWKKGPGTRFFDEMLSEFGKLPIIAEDMGLITPAVDALRNIYGFLGMRVYQFSCDYMFNEEDRVSRVFYTGTHDNDTIEGWLSETGFDGDRKEERKHIMKRLLDSGAAWVIFPLQDILGLDSSSRMNVPGTVSGNWAYIFDEGYRKAAVKEQ